MPYKILIYIAQDKILPTREERYETRQESHLRFNELVRNAKRIDDYTRRVVEVYTWTTFAGSAGEQTKTLIVDDWKRIL